MYIRSAVFGICCRMGVSVCVCLPKKPLKHAVSYIMSYSNIKPYTDVKLGSKSDIKPPRVRAARVRRDSFMCNTLRYMNTRDAATLNISCFTCGRKLETNDVFADRILMSCEKYEQWRHGHNSLRGKYQLPEMSKFFTKEEQTQICIIPNVWRDLQQHEKYKSSKIQRCWILK